ncbi:hypothetical protein KQX54_016754 [Cotesia glomerata]|uniref:Odorant receptor n=1 Tax=Cotesia glomerata TaxID=32391 RepID=A0AAV7HFB1_COTGL|nr:hypothetical protein KQX54_016754 [Cotesia glomerata]
MPYTIYYPWEVNTSTRYYLTYLPFGLLAFFMGFGGSTVDCILISLVFSISGKLAVLTVRIKTLYGGPDSRKKLNEIIAEHSRLLKMGAVVRNIHRAGLLLYLINIQFLICVIGYQVLICYMTGRESEAIKYILYILQMYLILVIYCVISEYLTDESLNCFEAFYKCSWYTLMIDCRKDILYCVKRSQKPLGLDAGKFATFSIIILTAVTKTAVGYLSVLRSFLIRE